MRRMIFACLTLAAFAAPAAADGLLSRMDRLERENVELHEALATLTERVSWRISFYLCPDHNGDGRPYDCTPRMCKDICEARGERIPTVSEAAAWSMFRRYPMVCRYVWLANIDVNQPPSAPGQGGLLHLIPVLHGYDAGRCLQANQATHVTTPREKLDRFAWDSEQRYDCACTNKPF